MTVLRWLSPFYWLKRYLIWKWTKDVVLAPREPSLHFDPLQPDDGDRAGVPFRRNADLRDVDGLLRRVEGELPEEIDGEHDPVLHMGEDEDYH